MDEMRKDVISQSRYADSNPPLLNTTQTLEVELQHIVAYKTCHLEAFRRRNLVQQLAKKDKTNLVELIFNPDSQPCRIRSTREL